MPIADGKPAKELSDDELKFMDLPGRRSHEYFPRLSADGKFMVWGATQRGHDHDIVRYEILSVGSRDACRARGTPLLPLRQRSLARPVHFRARNEACPRRGGLAVLGAGGFIRLAPGAGAARWVRL